MCVKKHNRVKTHACQKTHCMLNFISRSMCLSMYYQICQCACWKLHVECLNKPIVTESYRHHYTSFCNKKNKRNVNLKIYRILFLLVVIPLIIIVLTRGVFSFFNLQYVTYFEQDHILKHVE